MKTNFIDLIDNILNEAELQSAAQIAMSKPVSNSKSENSAAPEDGGESPTTTTAPTGATGTPDPLIKTMRDFETYPDGAIVWKKFVELCAGIQRGGIPTTRETIGRGLQGALQAASGGIVNGKAW